MSRLESRVLALDVVIEVLAMTQADRHLLGGRRWPVRWHFLRRPWDFSRGVKQREGGLGWTSITSIHIRPMPGLNDMPSILKLATAHYGESFQSKSRAWSWCTADWTFWAIDVDISYTSENPPRSKAVTQRLATSLLKHLWALVDSIQLALKENTCASILKYYCNLSCTCIGTWQ